MIIQVDKNYFVVLQDDFNLVREENTDEDGIDWTAIEKWVEENGMFISGEHYMILTSDEVRALVKEFSNTFISKENELCEKVIQRMMNFSKD